MCAKLLYQNPCWIVKKICSFVRQHVQQRWTVQNRVKVQQKSVYNQALSHFFLFRHLLGWRLGDVHHLKLIVRGRLVHRIWFQSALRDNLIP